MLKLDAVMSFFLIDEPFEFLKKFELIDEKQHVTNACYLLFCKGNVMQTSIQMGLFADEITIKDDQDTSVDILTQVDDVMRFVRKHVNKALDISSPRLKYSLKSFLTDLSRCLDQLTIHSALESNPDPHVLW